MKPTVTSTRILKLKGYLYEVFLQCEYAHTRDVTLLLQFEQQSCSSNQVRSSLHSAARLQHKNQLYTHSHTHTHAAMCPRALTWPLEKGAPMIPTERSWWWWWWWRHRLTVSASCRGVLALLMLADRHTDTPERAKNSPLTSPLDPWAVAGQAWRHEAIH